MKTTFDTEHKLVSLILRIALAAVFIVHGWSKISGDMGQLIATFGNMGIPIAPVTTWVVTIVEFFGGILVLLGLYTRYAALLIGIDMVGAMVFVKFAKGFRGGWEFDLALLAIALALVLLGDGTLALGNVVTRKQN